MRLLRGLLGALLWILAAVIGLVAAILCVTIILLPLGIPLLGVARRMFTSAVQLMLPPAVAHPAKTLDKKRRRKAKEARAGAADLGKGTSKKARKAVDTVTAKTTKRSRNPLRRRRRLLG